MHDRQFILAMSVTVDRGVVVVAHHVLDAAD